jgi:hypothetical protein
VKYILRNQKNNVWDEFASIRIVQWLYLVDTVINIRFSKILRISWVSEKLLASKKARFHRLSLFVCLFISLLVEWNVKDEWFSLVLLFSRSGLRKSVRRHANLRDSLWLSSVPPAKWWGSTSLKLWQLPSKSLSIDRLSIEVCSPDTNRFVH